MSRATGLSLAVAALCGVVACKGGRESSKRDRSPAPPAVPAAQEVATIALEVRGAAAEPITGQALMARAPDFESGDEHRAWRLSTVLGEHLEDGNVVVVGSSRGVSVTYRVPADPADKQPVLYLARRGKLAATLIDPGDPFPEFHGKGGMLGRPGDATPRVSPVLSIKIVATEGANKSPPMGAGAGSQPSEELLLLAHKSLVALEIVVDGKSVGAAKILQALKPTAVGDEHADGRPTWSLREVAKAVAGGKAHVLTLVGADGDKVVLEASEWSETTRTPILRGNRRGELKFHWLSSDGQVESTQLRRVARVEIAAN